MAFSLITGPARAGKTHIAHRVLLEASDSGLRPVLLMPSGPDVDRARRILADKVPVGLTVATTDALLVGLWRSWGDGRRIISEDQRRALLQQRRVEGAGRGVIELAARAAQHLAAVHGSAWRTVVYEVDEPGLIPDLLRAYATDLDAREMLESGECVSPIVSTGALDGCSIVLDGFSNLSPIQERLVHALLQRDLPVSLTLTWEEGRAATAAVDDLVVRMAALGSHQVLLGPRGAVPELRRVSEELFEGPEPRVPQGSLRFLSAEGADAEADLIVAEVQRLMASGVPGHEIAVVYRDLHRALSVARTTFRRSSVAASFDTALPFARTALGRSLRGLVQFLVAGERADLLVFARSPYASRDQSAAITVERRWRMSGETRGSHLVEELALLGDWQHECVRALMEPPGARDQAVAAWATLLDHMMLERHGDGTPTDPQAVIDADVRRGLGLILEELAALGADHLTPETILASLRSGKVALRSAEAPGFVQVMSAERVTGRAFRAVIVAGVEPGVYPAGADDMLGMASMSAYLKRCRADLTLNSEERDRLMFYMVATRATEHLLISRRRQDAAGTALGTSIYWEHLRDFYRAPDEDPEGDAELPSIERSLGIEAFVSGDHASHGLRQHMRRAATGPCDPDAGVPRRIHVARRRSQQSNSVLSESTRALLSGRTAFTVGELESYSQCPYRWFIERVLRSQALDYEFGQREHGTLAHRALSKFYPALQADGHRRMTPALLPELPARVDRAIDAVMDAAGVPPEHAAETVRAIRARLTRVLRQDATLLPGFTPDSFEIDVAGPASAGVDMGGYTLAGRIDRLDSNEDGAIVLMDYKSGSANDFAGARIRERSLLQLPLYMAILRKRGDRVVGILYRGMASDAKPRGAYLAACGGSPLVGTDVVDDLDELSEWAIGTADSAVAGIRNGDIRRVTSMRGCAHCAARAFCGGGAETDAETD